MILNGLLWLVSYCIVAWVVVTCLAFFTNVFRGVHPMMLIYAPLLPFMFTVDALSELGVKLHRRKLQKASKWVASELRKSGITVRGNYGISNIPSRGDDVEFEASGHDWLKDCSEVWTNITPSQFQPYRDVYARAIEHFPHLSPAQLCKGALPREPLNREWAKQISISEYFADEFCSPCVDCGTVRRWDILWGNDESHKKQHLADYLMTYNFSDTHKPPRTVYGHLCGECERKMDYTSAQGGFVQKCS